MLEQFFITGALPTNIMVGEYIPLLVLVSYVVASIGAFTGLTLAARMANASGLPEKRKLHWAGAISLGSGIWSMHFIGMLAYDMKMLHHYDPLLTTLSGIIAITVAWFVLKITQVTALSWKRISVSAILLGLGIATMHYTGMAAMQMDASLRYIPSLFILSLLIAIAASGAALCIILVLGRITSRKQIAWRSIAALVMGVAICGMHYTGMAASVLIPFANCRFATNQSFSMLGTGVIATTGLICMISLMLGTANRLLTLVACAAVFSFPLGIIMYQEIVDFDTHSSLVLLSGFVTFFGFIGMLVFLFRSLTRTERAERDARHAKATAEQAAAAKSDFLANMSHELRTPMNGVLGMAHLLADTELTAEQKEFVSTINGSAENLLMLLNDILDFSKIEAGALTLENIAYDVKETVTGAMNLLRPQADKKGIDLRVECEPDVPAYIWGDSGRMRQIVINLAGNAIKFTENGYVRLTVRMQEQDDGSYLHISVEDTGMGIPADKLGEIFDKFTQADASVTRKFGGTGLGLAITKQLVTLMGGHISVESAEGKGSTFWFIIPCRLASEQDASPINENRSINCVATENRLPIADAKILLVEDYPVNQIFAEKLLRKFGVRHIDVAENGVQALLKYRTQAYDMIFMDCQMPELDGYQATAKLRMLEEGTPLHTPIVAMTANAMMGDREKCLKAGMDDYLSKPLRAEHLRKILEAWFLLDANKASITTVKYLVATPKEVEETPVDMAQLRIFTDGDPEEGKALADLFLEQAQAMIAILQKSTGAESHEAWKSAAHRFKGSSGNLGAMKLHHLCKRAETHFNDEEMKKLEMLAAIQAETLRVEIFFQS